MRMRLLLGYALLALLTTACTTNRTYIASSQDAWEDTPLPPGESYTAFLIGDTGDPLIPEAQPLFRFLKRQLDAASEQSVIVFLGDNIYCCGLPDSAESNRSAKEEVLDVQLDALAGFPGEIVFIPGNHDWNSSKPGGLRRVRNQEHYIENALDRGNTFLPDDGFPGPVVKELTDDLILIAIDTEWWITDHEKSFGDTGEYEVEETNDIILELDEIIKDNRKKRILVVGHHPMFSYGRHSGFIPPHQHIFPLTAKWENAFVPLPVLGSIYPLYVRYRGTRQDLAHPRNKAMRRSLMKVFEQHPDLVYASGHEHSLQYFKTGPHTAQNHYLVSGAGARPEPVGKGHLAQFTHSAFGFMTLHYYDNGAIWLQAWQADLETPNGQLVFRTQIKHADPPTSPEVNAALTYDALPDYADSTVVVAANAHYGAGPLKRFFLGSHRRKAWTTPVELPVLDLGREEGGLTPTKRGGGMQTFSVRLEREDGREFVLRSIDKDPSSTVPENLQGTVATDLVQDQIATLHPYSAYVIPALARAVGVYHTNPKAVFVPDDPRLGIYRETFGNKPMMLEDRPDDDMSDVASYGNSENVKSTHSMFEDVNGDNDNYVDQPFFLRSRLFDMLLSDWDRHRDQWRWASFDVENGEMYRPIPRDRDWAFNMMDGFLPTIYKILQPRFQSFDPTFKNLKGLTFNGLELDRRFTNELSREQWIAIARDIQTKLTDQVIEDAIHEGWPAPIVEVSGNEIIANLKSRRDQLHLIAEQYYEIQARIVDVVGSDKHERFEVTRTNDRETEVVVYKTSKEGEIRKELYRRTFFTDETEEIRLYGQDGHDQFIISGSTDQSILVRAIGGGGDDRLEDASRVRGVRRLTHFYDSERTAALETDSETKLHLSNDPSNNAYNPLAFQHNATLPLPFFGYSKDDGVFIGAGISRIRHGFRKDPFAAQHTIKVNFAALTRAFNLEYMGSFREALGTWDAGIELTYLAPNTFRNFYGLGNETTQADRDAEFYQARFTRFTFAPLAIWTPTATTSVRLGPRIQFTDVREDDDRFLNTPQPGVSRRTFDPQWLASLLLEAELAQIDNVIKPTLGFRWLLSAEGNVGVEAIDDSFARLSTALTSYASPFGPNLNVAWRIGAATNIGDFPFYEANTLGGRNNLRGHRSTRYAGRSNVFGNIEARVSIADFSSYIAIGDLGVIGFTDVGRVWTDDERSTLWHAGYGGGLWLSLFDSVILRGTMGFSEDDQEFNFGLGFFY